jgi:hypothetical protein
MNIQNELYTLRAGLRNKDYRPGAEQAAAVRRLAQLSAMQDSANRPRPVIRFRTYA